MADTASDLFLERLIELNQKSGGDDMAEPVPAGSDVAAIVPSLSCPWSVAVDRYPWPGGLDQ